MTAHKHAALMLQYAQDAAESETPWDRWEVCRNGTWYDGFTDHPSWALEHEYRRKPRTININGYAVPEPVRKPFKRGDQYWLAETSRVVSFTWSNDDDDRQWLADGLIHLTQEAAQTHADALLSFTRVVEV